MRTIAILILIVAILLAAVEVAARTIGDVGRDVVHTEQEF